MPDLNEMIDALDKFRDMHDVSEWENNFILSIIQQIERSGNSTKNLSNKQVEKIDQLYTKHIIKGR